MSLDENSFMECEFHGIRKPTFICRHLHHGSKRGFFEGTNSELPWLKLAWCQKCERISNTIGRIPLIGYPMYLWCSKPMCICEGCYEVIRARNLPPNPDP
jgi:hypothetical protein